MEYKLAEPSFNIASGDNWLMILKHFGANLLVSIVVVFVIYMILKVFIGDVMKNPAKVFNGGLMVAIPIIAVIMMGQMYTLSLFENWDGCYKRITPLRQ